MGQPLRRQPLELARQSQHPSAAEDGCLDGRNAEADRGNRNLDLPIVCRGVRIDQAALGDGGDRISAQVVEQRLLALRMPMMQGSDVLEIQRALIRAGERTLAADGVFGLETERAVRQYQERHGLTVDGIVGPATRSALEDFADQVIRLAAE